MSHLWGLSLRIVSVRERAFKATTNSIRTKERKRTVVVSRGSLKPRAGAMK